MTSSKPNSSSPLHADLILVWILRAMATLSAGIVLLIMAFLIAESLPALRRTAPIRFLTDPSWNPNSGLFNMTPMIAASATITFGAIFLAAPLGIGSALFSRYYAPRPLAIVYRRIIELLAGIPSVVFGLWGLVVLTPMFSHGLLTGVLILAIMVLPTVALFAEVSFARVPEMQIRGAAALGLGRWATIQRLILPAARKGIVTAIILAGARAVGETMAVLMVCGNVVKMPASLDGPIRTLTANIALEMAYAEASHRSALFVSGLLLMLCVGLLLAGAEWFSKGRRLYG